MTEPEEMILSTVIKLIPFLLSLPIYFFGFVPHCDNVLVAFTKCLPVGCLLVFIGLFSIDIKEEYYCYSYKRYSRMITMGLICYGIGDILSVWSSTHEYSVAAYVAGQLHYIWGFGFRPPVWFLTIPLFICGIIGCAALDYYGDFSLENLIIIAICAFVTLTLVWRAWAPLIKYRSWINFIRALGTIIFAIADALIIIQKHEIEHERGFPTALYYLAQLLIILGITQTYFPPVHMDAKFV